MRNKLCSVEFQRTFPTIPDLYLVSAYTLWIMTASSVVMSREAVRKHCKKKTRALSRGVWFLFRIIFVRMFRPATRTSANLTADPVAQRSNALEDTGVAVYFIAYVTSVELCFLQSRVCD